MVKHFQEVDKMADARSRAWLFVFYPESAPADWAGVIDSWGCTCYVSPCHDADVTAEGELKKPHYHGVLTFEGKKTYTQALALVAQLGCATVKVCNSLHNALRYLVHLDNPDKAQYALEDLRTFGHADLSHLYARNESDVDAGVIEVMRIANRCGLWEFCDLIEYLAENRATDLFPLVRANHAFIRSYLQSRVFAMRSSMR